MEELTTKELSTQSEPFISKEELSTISVKIEKKTVKYYEKNKHIENILLL